MRAAISIRLEYPDLPAPKIIDYSLKIIGLNKNGLMLYP